MPLRYSLSQVLDNLILKLRRYANKMKILIQAPELFTTTPSLAIPKAISNASLNASQIDLYEINEAFAVCPL